MSKCIYFVPSLSHNGNDYCKKKRIEVNEFTNCADCKKGKYTVELSWKKIDRLIQILEESPFDCDKKILNKLRSELI